MLLKGRNCKQTDAEKFKTKEHKRCISVVQLLSHVRLFVTTWTAAHLASLFFTISWSLLKLMSIELVMLSNHFGLPWWLRGF